MYVYCTLLKVVDTVSEYYRVPFIAGYSFASAVGGFRSPTKTSLHHPTSFCDVTFMPIYYPILFLFATFVLSASSG